MGQRLKRKICTVCKIEKSLSDFYRNSIALDGRESQCIPCKRANARAWHKANSERASVLHRAWRARHPGANARYCRAYAQRNPEHVRALKREWARRQRTQRKNNDGDKRP